MRQFLLAAAAAGLFAGPALAQSNVTVVTPPAPALNSVVVSPSQTATDPSRPAYDSKTIEHSSNGFSDKTKKTEEHVDPDGSTTSSTKIIKHDE